MVRGGYRQGSGRKKGFAAKNAEMARELICRKLSESLDPIIDRAIAQAKKGDRHAREWLVDRAFGKAKPTHDDFDEMPLPIPIYAGRSSHTQL